MGEVTPKHVLCVLGSWKDLHEVEAIVKKEAVGFEVDLEFSQLENDPRMKVAFEASMDQANPSMLEGDWLAIAKHEAVVYVLSPPVVKERAAEIAGQALIVVGALLVNGGVAAKNESSGYAHGRDHWLELTASYREALKAGNTFAQGASLYRAWVRRPLVDTRAAVFYSCGLHLLGERDVEVDISVGPESALLWLDLLGLYIAADRPTRSLKDGEGFRLSSAGPRRILRLAPCNRYPDDDFLFNPFGYIRLESEKLQEQFVM